MTDETSVKLIKLLWRLDYNLSYAIYDKRGPCVRALLQTVPDFLKKVGEARAQNRFTGETEDEGLAVNVSVDPTSISGAIEWPLGTALGSVLQHTAFRNTNKIASELMAIAEVANATRFGIRFILLVRKTNLAQRYNSVSHMFDDVAKRAVSDILGEIEDAAITTEGKAKDGINYRLSYGPFAQKNIDLHLNKTKDSVGQDYYSEFNAVIDLDLYENNFFLIEKSLYRWSTDRVAKADMFVQNVLGN